MHGAGHEELLKRRDPSLHASILFDEAVVALFKMSNVFSGLAQDLNFVVSRTRKRGEIFGGSYRRLVELVGWRQPV